MSMEGNASVRGPKKTEQKAVTAAPVMENAGAVVYIGPSIKHVVQRGTAFKNGFPPKFKKELEKYPLLGGLLIPVSGLAAAKSQLKTAESSLYMLYREAEKLEGDRVNV